MMPHDLDEETLLSQFRQWLQEAYAEADALEPETPFFQPVDQDVGLYRVVEEFTALRHELKLQTKSARGLQEQAETLLQALPAAMERLRVVSREAHAAWAAGKPLAEALADLDEALERGRAELERAGPLLIEEPVRELVSALKEFHGRRSWFRRWWYRSYHEQVLEVVHQHGPQTRRDLFDALLEGYSLIQARLRRTMNEEQVCRIECAGQPVDPAFMTVIEVVDAPDLPPGRVIAEIRRGYTWQDQVFRFAEVRASRATATSCNDQPGKVRD